MRCPRNPYDLIITAFEQLHQQMPGEANSFGEGLLNRLTIATVLSRLPDLAIASTEASTFEADVNAASVTSGLLDSLEQITQGIALLASPVTLAFNPDELQGQVYIIEGTVLSLAADGSLIERESGFERLGSWSVQEDGSLLIGYADGMEGIFTLLADRTFRLIVNLDLTFPDGGKAFQGLSSFAKTVPFSAGSLAGNVYALDNGVNLAFAVDGTGWASFPFPDTPNSPYLWEVNEDSVLKLYFQDFAETDSIFLLGGGHDDAFRMALYGYNDQGMLLGPVLRDAILFGPVQ